MFILLTLAIFILKFLAVAVVGLFFLEDLHLTREVASSVYYVYFTLGVITFAALFFFVLGKKMLWLIVCLVCGSLYFGMYNATPAIKAIHQEHDLKSRYFKDTNTFFTRMKDVAKIIKK